MNSKHRRILTGLLCMFFILAVVNQGMSQDDAGSLAKDAFHAIESKPFDSDNLEDAFADIGRAEKLNPEEPWVAIAKSRAFLAIGYSRGNRFRKSSYREDLLDKARQYAEQAISLSPAESAAYSQLAHIEIILGNHRTAWDILNNAYRKNPDDFYPWYFRSVISTEMKDRERSESALEEARKRIVLPYQERFVLQQKRTIAAIMGDDNEMEAAYKAIIDHDPESAHAYGNYGNFLLRLGRYDEAIANNEKAVSISPYPLALEQLERARELKEGSQ